MAEPSKGNGSQPGSDPGLSDFLVGTTDPAEREKTVMAYSFFQQGQPSGFSAHLATLFKAFARTLMAAAVRIEKAAEAFQQAASLQAKLTDAQVEALSKALGEDVKRAASWFRYREYVVNWGLVATIGGLCAILGAGIVGWIWHDKHQALLNTPEYCLVRDLGIIKGGMEYTTEVQGNVLKIIIKPGPNWLTLRPAQDNQGNVTVTIYNPRAVQFNQ